MKRNFYIILEVDEYQDCDYNEIMEETRMLRIEKDLAKPVIFILTILHVKNIRTKQYAQRMRMNLLIILKDLHVNQSVSI